MELLQKTLSDDEIIGADADVTQDKDDSDIGDPKATPIISHTDGAKALEMALCYVEQQASASTIDVLLLKNSEIMWKSSNFLSSAEKNH